jgi:UDP-3-O-[3-hydroxymyristoyl] glucosamine N-acyltransferase
MPIPPQAVVLHRSARRNVDIDGFAAARGLAIVAYVDAGCVEQPTAFGGVPVVSFAAWCKGLREIPSIVTAVDPAERRALAERIAAAGGAFATLGRSGGAVSPTVRFGAGTLVGDGPLSINRSTTFGRHVLIATPASVGHDCAVGDFVTIHPSAAISGYVTIEDDVVIGVGAVIVNGLSSKTLRVGRGARIETGAVVTKSVPAGAIIVGNPGRPVRS